MPNIDPVDIQVMRVVAEDVREIKKQLLGNGSVGMFEQVRVNAGDIDRLWKAVEKLGNSVDLLADLPGIVDRVENSLGVAKNPGADDGAKWYARGKFWLWATAATGVVGHIVNFVSVVLESLL
jgi:hypothetical protein